MAPESPDYAAFEIDARNVQNVINAFRLVPQIAHRILVKHGFGTLGADDRFMPQPVAWFPLPAWLAGLKEIQEAVGPGKMFEVGKLVPTYAALPPTITDLVSALQSLDVAYHLNHRKNGQVMFDVATGRMLDGIGHYTYLRHEGETRATCVCQEPYPCDMDRGILWGFGMRFGARVHVEHASTKSCRKTGGESCTYVVTW